MPVLWSGRGEKTLIRKGMKKVMASISLNCFSSIRNGNQSVLGEARGQLIQSLGRLALL